jgi:hypothetical protein
MVNWKRARGSAGYQPTLSKRADNPERYRDLARQFILAAMRAEDAGGRKFNDEQAQAWFAYADNLEARQAYLAQAQSRPMPRVTVTSADIPRLP